MLCSLHMGLMPFGQKFCGCVGLVWALVCPLLSETELARLCIGEQLTCARLVLLDMLPYCRLFCLSLSKFWGWLAALVVDGLPLTACGFFRSMYMYVQ